MKLLDRLFNRKPVNLEPLPAEFTPRPSMFNACLRIEHDLNNNPYQGYGIDLAGLSDAEFAEKMNSASASLVIYHQSLTPEMVAYARSGEFRNLVKKQENN